MGWKRFGKAKIKHEEGFVCFSWFPRIIFKNESGYFLEFLKSGMGRVWEGKNEI